MFKRAAQQLRERWAGAKASAYENALLFLALMAVAVVFVAIVFVTHVNDAMGFSDKDFWDWMDLLIVPVVFAAGAYYFSQSQKQAEFEVALDRQRHDMLQDYYDKVSELLLESDLVYDGTKEGTANSDAIAERKRVALSIASARTVMVLRGLDGDRVSTLFNFLYSIRVDNQKQLMEVIRMQGARFIGVDWRGADLVEVNLSQTRMARANLAGADLGGANLEDADLSDANLARATMYGTRLKKADLSRADLTGAKVTLEQLLEADSLEGATMPDGTKYERRLKRL